MEIKDIKRIVELMKNNDLTEFSMKDNEFRLDLKRGGGEPSVVYAAPAAAPIAAAPVPPAPAAAPADTAAPVADDTDGMVEIPSPIVGTFYRKPAPDADNFCRSRG